MQRFARTSSPAWLTRRVGKQPDETQSAQEHLQPILINYGNLAGKNPSISSRSSHQSGKGTSRPTASSRLPWLSKSPAQEASSGSADHPLALTQARVIENSEALLLLFKRHCSFFCGEVRHRHCKTVSGKGVQGTVHLQHDLGT